MQSDQENQTTGAESQALQQNQFQTEAAPQSTAQANTRPNDIAQTEATKDNAATSSEDAAIESNGATADADKTPGETHSHNAPPQN